jgi:hypothetical protein
MIKQIIQTDIEIAICEGMFTTFIERTDAIGYAFKINNGKFIRGEYIFPGETIDENLFDGFIDFKSNLDN